MSRKRWVLRVVLMNSSIHKQRRLNSRRTSPGKGSGLPLLPRSKDNSFTMTPERKGRRGSLKLNQALGLDGGRADADSFDSAVLPLLIQLGQLEVESNSRKCSVRPSFDLLDLPGSSLYREQVLDCGLRQDQAFDLMSRDLTPEDFEMLSALDEKIPKRNTADQGVVDKLARRLFHDGAGKECGVCLSALDTNSDAVELPCKHCFHSACISKWLTECKNACPICLAPIQRPDDVQVST